jgi:site-specific DNA-cytosine methylase
MSWVEPTWSTINAVDVLKKTKPCKTVAYDSRMNKDIYAKHLHKMKPGMRLRTLFQKVLYPDPAKRIVKDNGHIKGCPGFGHIKLKDAGPASATVGYSMIHPTENRFLTVNEVAALAGFPSGYKFVGGELGAQQLDLIARGVCPPVGEWLGKSVKQSLEMNIPVRKPVVSIVDFRARWIAPVIIGG